MSEPLGKMQIVNHLAAAHGYATYLEICTISTGGGFAEVDRRRLSPQRLMYRCPGNYSDGLPIDFRSRNLDISGCIGAIAQAGRRYDAILVDPHHIYLTSRRDIEVAFELLNPGGSLIVHDCLPPDEARAAPHWVEGIWCGVTYKAFIDVVTGGNGFTYYTVDTDYGCGVIRKLRQPAALPKSDSEQALIAQWNALGDDFAAAYRFFAEHHRDLLRLVAPADFFRIEGAASLPIPA